MLSAQSSMSSHSFLLHTDRADFSHERVIALFAHVWRLTAPNPSVMTGPGTNTYIVGDEKTGFIVLDPGPWRTSNAVDLAKDQAHLQRLLQFTGGNVQHIVCTHSHPDHSPAAKPLQTWVQQLRGLAPPIYGMASAATAKDHSFFRPDVELKHGDYVVLNQTDQPLQKQYQLQAIYTPGHAANHVSFFLEQGRLLLCGDHVLGGATPVVIPPDGDMSDYLKSLDLLEQYVAAHQIAYLLPAHGHVLAKPKKVLCNLREHRLRREAVVLQTIQASPHASFHVWLHAAYAGLPEHLLQIAGHTLRAHALRLASLHPELAQIIERALRE